MFPPSLEDLVPEDHPVRVIGAYGGLLDLGELGFERGKPTLRMDLVLRVMAAVGLAAIVVDSEIANMALAARGG